MGSTCTPTPPGCDYGAACGDPDPSRAEACINFCVPVFEGAVLGDVPCPLDECDEAAWTIPGVVRCPSPNAAGQSYTCAASDRSPDPSRIGFCRAVPGLLDECTPGTESACESGAFCVDSEACGGRFDVSPSFEGYCWLPAREGERCDSDLGRGVEGCAPCEAGTWCRVTDDYGRICVRACETPDAPGVERPELCACEGVAEPCVVMPAPAGTPQIYCRPRVVPNGHRCDPQTGPPCEDFASECQPTADPLRGSVFVCCRRDGDECETDADCCEGRSRCHAGVCTACGGADALPTEAGCCPGHVVVDDASGEPRCRSCAVSREGRERALFEGASCEGEFVQLETEDGGRDTIAVPVDGNTGAGAAELPAASGDTSRVRYALRPEHRLFLLQGNLTGEWTGRDPPADPPAFLPSADSGWPPAGTTVGHAFAHLPANFPGVAVRELSIATLPGRLPTSTWESLRVYDAGACSRFVEYGPAVDGLVASLNRFLVELSFDFGGVTYGSTPLELAFRQPDYPEDDTEWMPHITPILSSGRGDFGRAIDNDQLNVFLEYAAIGGAALGCEDGRIRLSAGVRLSRRPAFLPTLDGELEDRRVVEWHDCGSGCREQCQIDGDRYLCRQVTGPSPPGSTYVARPRLVRAVRDAVDFAPQIEFFDGGLVDCSASGLNDLLTGVLQGQIRGSVGSILSQLAGSLTRDLREWGIPYADLAPCGRVEPETGETFASDAMCSDAEPRWFGGRRHGCVGIDDAGRFTDEPALARDFRCARVRLEIRRVNLRPDGIELVVADSDADPQYGMLTTSPRLELRDLCDPRRDGARPFDQLAEVATIARATGLLSQQPQINRVICHPDDPLAVSESGVLVGCRGICSERGIPCGLGTPRDETVDARRRCYVQPLERLPGGHTDRGAGECCRPEDFCPVPATAGGRPYFETAPAEPVAASTTWRCVDPTSDAAACGGCGNACGAGEACCDSGCRSLATDPGFCGRCDHACPADTPCVDGRCCAVGELACPSGDGLVCTDVSSSPFACGDCETPCASGHCTNGVCCVPGQTGCGGSCADLRNDAANCGACGAACAAGQSCCGGACVNLASDPRHCGTCGRRCPRGPCLAGVCRCIGPGCP